MTLKHGHQTSTNSREAQDIEVRFYCYDVGWQEQEDRIKFDRLVQQIDTHHDQNMQSNAHTRKVG